jgi:hypothetical protein
MIQRMKAALGGVLVVLVAGAADAQQVREVGAGIVGWRVGLEERAGLADGWADGGAREARGSGIEGLLVTEPPPVARETLEGSAETLQRYDGLPGGIVLGLEARPQGELAAASDGARIRGSVADGLELLLADGRVLRAPRIAPERLVACIAFAGARDDALVDLHLGANGEPRVAAAFAGSALQDELVALDRVPHRELPETTAWKSLIVDREVRMDAREGALALDADLEVRFYLDGRGWARRLLTVGVAGASWVGPRLERDLGDELAPLAELAGWIGFLRWAERVDPEGSARLRSEAAAAAYAFEGEGH